jgi:hypothetical protein
VSAVAKTLRPEFGGHTRAGGFEGGHFSVSLTTAASQESAARLTREGDAMSDNILNNGIVGEFQRLNMVDGVPLPKIISLNAAQCPPGYRLPLYWHEQLTTDNGAALADYPGTEQLLLGAAIQSVGQRGLDIAANNVALAVRGREY